MAETTGDFLVRRLSEWGVRRVYGYPGDGINGVMGALQRAKGKIDFIQVRHEEMAAFMACAHAKFTGEPGVCMATSGPGAIHLLNGLYDAKLDHQPVVAIVGQSSRLAMGGSYQQEVDLQNLFKDVASEFAADEVIEVAELLGAGVAKALLGKAALPDAVPFVTGSIGLLGTKPSWVLMDECDTLLMVGSSFPYPEFLPEEGKARGVQIDIDGRMLSIRYPMEVNLVGDSKESLRGLIPMLQLKSDRSWRQRIEKEIVEWWKLLETRAMTSADPINPQRVFWELSPRLPDRCIIAADSGSAASWYARDLKFRKGMMGSLSGNLATMGPGVPYVIAAKFAFPDRVAIACVGDGAFQMNGMNEMITVAKYWREWSDPRLIVCVLENRDLNMVTWEQRVMDGDRKFEASQEVPGFRYDVFAESLGLKGLRIEEN